MSAVHHRWLDEIDAQLDDLRTERTGLIQRTQEACGHPIEFVIEGDYAPETWLHNAKPDFRVCRKCGYAEEGWGFYCDLYYGIKVPVMPRDDAWTYVLTFLERPQVSRKVQEKERR